MHFLRRARVTATSASALLSLSCLAVPGFSQWHTKTGRAWMNTSLSSDERADLVLKEMTLDEKIAMLHGVGMPTDDPLTQENMPSNRGVGYEVGVPRLGIPGIDMSDAAYGVRSSGANGRYSTAMPANVAAAASWDIDAAYEYGKLIGTRVARPGLQHDPRRRRQPDARTPQRPHLRDLGEDPVLAGTGRPPHSGHASQQIIGDINTMPSTTRRAAATRSTSPSPSGRP